MLANIPQITLRRPTPADLDRLGEIQAGYATESVFNLRTKRPDPATDPDYDPAEMLEYTWRLEEIPFQFDKGTRYDLGAPDIQDGIRERAARPEDCFQRVADFEGKLVGFIDLELHDNAATLWNLHIDKSYRREGLGRRLWLQAREFTKKAGIYLIWIETQNTNVGAVRFYRALNCELVGFHPYAYGSDPRLPNEFAIYMVHRIGR